MYMIHKIHYEPNRFIRINCKVFILERKDAIVSTFKSSILNNCNSIFYLILYSIQNKKVYFANVLWPLL